jgi:hypothetical protein
MSGPLKNSMVEKAERLRQRLVDLVGEEETAAVLADSRYTPWWLEG